MTGYHRRLNSLAATTTILPDPTMSKVPISIESLLQKQKEEREAASKPKFLSKEERARIAIEKRKAEIQHEKEKADKLKAQREALNAPTSENNLGNREVEDFRSNNRARGRDSREYDDRDSRYDDRRRDPRGHDDKGRGTRSVPTGPRADRNKGPPKFVSRSGDMAPPPVPTKEKQNPANSTGNTSGNTDDGVGMTSSELSAIRSRYLGVDKKKRPVRKLSDRKFVFDWAEQDDTFAMDSPSAVGSQRQGAAVMFGRGHLAGMENTSIPHLPPRSDANSMALDPRKKAPVDERHWSEKPLEEMKDRDWRIFREDFSISARGGNIPPPLRSWEESAIPPALLDVIAGIGYKDPSPIQRQAIPIGLQNRDLIGIAETGSGKTAAFVIPMLTYISELPPLDDDNRHLGPYALIMAPTRELAQQIEGEAKRFATPLGYKCVSIVGGRAVEEQQFNLREGAEIIIATPGRLKDVIDRHVLVLSQCTYVVMDEADRMVHLGFEADLTFILDALPNTLLRGENAMDVDGNTNIRARTRVTTLFSATMPPAVERLARKYLKKAATITIGEAGRAVDTVEQRVEFVNGEEKKKQRLVEVLNTGGFLAPIIVFVNQKKTADMVAKDLQRAHWSASTLHSGKSQEQREAALAQLRNGEVDVLVATDLAGRGIDVPDVSLVINFQMANTIEAYVHRIGRTGRAGKQGVSITFLTNDDDEVMYDLKQEISKSPISKVPPELARHEAAQQKITREMKRKRDDDQG